MAKTPETRPEIVNIAALKGCVEQQLDWCLVSYVHCSLHPWGIQLMRMVLMTREVLLWDFTNCNFNTEGTYLEPENIFPFSNLRLFPVCCSPREKH